MLRVALTGGAGSGKSVAAAMLRETGADVSQSDEVARVMMRPGEAMFQEIARHFGAAAVGADGELDRRALARIAFGEGRLEELNAIVHPAVIAAQMEWMRRVEQEDVMAVAIAESALVFETKHGGADGDSSGTPWRARFDRVVVVTASEPVRLERVIARGLRKDPNADLESLRADALLRFAAQMPEEQKAALADEVVRNDGSIESLREKMGSLYCRLKAESKDRGAGAM